MANQALPRPRLTGPQPVAGQEVKKRLNPLVQSSDGVLADRVFGWLIRGCAWVVLAILALIVWQLVSRSQPSWHAFGWKFFGTQDWDPVNDHYGALPFVYGTLVSSLLSLLIAVPLAVGVAVFTTEMCPKWLRGPVSFTTELLAAIPSVIYGLWAIIIVPIISSISREVLSVVPQQQREAALALGATRWEMIRIAVLRNARAGIVGGIILGLGRALGETMAVTMVIGNRPEIAKSLFAPGYTMASVLANEFSEAAGDLYLSALIEIGLALFLVTIIVNALARFMVWSVTRGQPARGRA